MSDELIEALRRRVSQLEETALFHRHWLDKSLADMDRIRDLESQLGDALRFNVTLATQNKELETKAREVVAELRRFEQYALSVHRQRDDGIQGVYYGASHGFGAAADLVAKKFGLTAKPKPQDSA